jgi:hypothetical protein
MRNPLSFWSFHGLRAGVGGVVLVAAVGSGCISVRERVVEEPRGDPAPVMAPPVASPPPPVASASVWDDDLAPYGSWAYSGRYGRVWVPNTLVVGASWRPYTYGHWVLTEWGWTWTDDQPWAYPVHHYGRWAWDPAYGWVWVPDTVWGPAWVVWRTGPLYVGWAPLGPGLAWGSDMYLSDGSWIFVETGYMTRPGLYRHVVWGPGYRTCITTTVVYHDVRHHHGWSYNHGPSPGYVSSRGGRTQVTPVAELNRTQPVFRPTSGDGRHGSGQGNATHGPSDVGAAGTGHGAGAGPGGHGAPDNRSPSPGAGTDPSGHGPTDVGQGDSSRGHGGSDVPAGALPAEPAAALPARPAMGAVDGTLPADSPVPRGTGPTPPPRSGDTALPAATGEGTARSAVSPGLPTRYDPARSFRWSAEPTGRRPAPRVDASPSLGGSSDIPTYHWDGQPGASRPDPGPTVTPLREGRAGGPPSWTAPQQASPGPAPAQPHAQPATPHGGSAAPGWQSQPARPSPAPRAQESPSGGHSSAPPPARSPSPAFRPSSPSSGGSPSAGPPAAQPAPAKKPPQQQPQPSQDKKGKKK